MTDDGLPGIDPYLGYIRVDRGIVDHPALQTDGRFRLWMRILTRAVARPDGYDWFPEKGKPVHLERGEVVVSATSWGPKVGLSKKQVLRTLKGFQTLGMIRPRDGHYLGTIYRVVNYDTYNPLPASDVPQLVPNRERRLSPTGSNVGTNGVHEEVSTNQPTNLSNQPRARGALDPQPDEPETEALKDFLGDYASVVDRISNHVGHQAWTVNVWFSYRPQAHEMPQCELGTVPQDARPAVLAGALSALHAELVEKERRKVDSRHFAGFVRREVRGFHTAKDYDPNIDQPKSRYGIVGDF